MTNTRNMSLYNLNRDVIRGKTNGRVLWQPRINCWFGDRDFAGIPYEEPYAGLSQRDVYRKLECSARNYVFQNSILQFYLDDTIRESRRDLDKMRWEETIDTPVGRITCIRRRNNSNYGVFPEKWFVENEQDMKVLIYVLERTSYKFDKKIYDELFADCADLGLPIVNIKRAGIQALFIMYMGVEGAIYALADYPDTVEEFFKVCERSNRRYMDAAIEGKFEWVTFGDNVHGKVLPPDLFVKYLLPVYQERSDYLRRHGIFTSAHWDGDVKPLLPYIKETGLDAIEAITPLPQGDITLAEAKAAMGDKYLMDGIAAILFDELFPVEMLMTQVKECMELFPDRLIMGISDEISSTGKLERIKRVSDYVNEYNAKI